MTARSVEAAQRAIVSLEPFMLDCGHFPDVQFRGLKLVGEKIACIGCYRGEPVFATMGSSETRLTPELPFPDIHIAASPEAIDECVAAHPPPPLPRRPQAGGGRPTKGCRLKDGSRVPSVTTILGRFKESGGLIQWAYKQGLEGLDINKTRDEAGNAGSLAHDLIEADILDADPKLPSAEQLKMSEEDYAIALVRANRAFGAFRRWRRSVSLEVLWTELPLVSETHRFGGTIDAVAVVGGCMSIADWKSSGKIWPEYLVQVAAYRFLWEEANPEPENKIKSIHLVRVDKEFASFAHHSWEIEVIDIAWSAFALMLPLYRLDAILKKATG